MDVGRQTIESETQKSCHRSGDRIHVLQKAGELLFGDRWLRPLARKLGIDHALLSRIIAGDRTMTFPIRAMAALVFEGEADRLAESAAALRTIAQRINARFEEEDDD